MPTYEYRCKTCDTRFEVVQSIKNKTLTRCPKKNGPSACTNPGKGEVAKVFAAPGIAFKGEGFYKTDSTKSTVSAKSSKTDSATADPSDKRDSTSGKSDSSSKSDGSSDKGSTSTDKSSTSSKKPESSVGAGSSDSGSSD